MNQFMEFVEKGDYSGARAILQFNNEKERSFIRDLWIAFCDFELGEYEEAYKIYKELSYLDSSKYSQYIQKDNLKLYASICQFWMRNYGQIKMDIEELPINKLSNRFKLHLYQRIGDEEGVLRHHSKLEDVPADHLCLASMNFIRGHYTEALKCFKMINEQDPNDTLTLYAAMCYYKLEYYDKCLATIDQYLVKENNSFIASNLKACVYYKLFKIKEAQLEINPLINVYPNGFNKILQHNYALFTNDDQCLKVWHDCVKVLPEAACNIVLYYLKQNQLKDAKEMADKINPIALDEMNVKAVCFAEYGQQYGNKTAVDVAIQLFEAIGLKKEEENTILGRQCMASSLFLTKNYEEAEIYIDSIKSYLINSDAHHFNTAQIKLRLKKFEEVVLACELIKSEELKNTWGYIYCLTMGLINTQKADQSWEMYVLMDTTNLSFNLLNLIANTSYKTEQYYYAFKAFDILYNVDPHPDNWHGKRGAICGLLKQHVEDVTNKVIKTQLEDAISMMQQHNGEDATEIMALVKKFI